MNVHLPSPSLKDFLQLANKVNGKAKGSGFENVIAKLLSKSFDPFVFKRSQSSGAILGGVNVKHIANYGNVAKNLFVGDVVPINEDSVIESHKLKFKYSIECKFYKDADSFTSLFNNPQIVNWFNQACTDADKVDKEPALIFKFNRTPVFIGLLNINVDIPNSITITNEKLMHPVKIVLLDTYIKYQDEWLIKV